MIRLQDCIPRHVYRIRSRNLEVGVFVPESKGFIGIREKFKRLYLFTEYHEDTGPPFGTVTPLEDLGIVLPDNIKTVTFFQESVCFNCGVPAEYDLTKPRESYPGTWVHLKNTGCTNVSPVSVENKALFKFLEEIEASLGIVRTIK